MNRLAQKIMNARKAANMTEKELALKAGLNLNYLLQVESGKKVVNEQTAQKILDILGAEEQFIKHEEKEVPKKPVIPVEKKAPSTTIEVPLQWQSALSGVLKQYPIYIEGTDKVIGQRECIISDKKVDGIHYEKILFLKIKHSELPQLRILKDDILTLQDASTIENFKIYYFAYKSIKMVRMLKIEGSKVLALKDLNDSKPDVYAMADIKIIGKCIKNTFYFK